MGGGEAAVSLPYDVVSSGLGTMWLWQAAHLNMLVSARTKFLVSLDWAKHKVIGRDVSRF